MVKGGSSYRRSRSCQSPSAWKNGITSNALSFIGPAAAPKNSRTSQPDELTNAPKAKALFRSKVTEWKLPCFA